MRALAEPRAPGPAVRSPLRWGDLRLRTASAVVLAPAVLACVWFGGVAWAALVAVAAAGLAVEWAALCGIGRGSGRGVEMGWLLAGVPYLGVPLLALVWLHGRATGRDDVLFVMLVVWASDIGAYLVGRVVGGPKLAPSISPGKTRSGAVGGLMAAMVVGAVVVQMISPGLAWRAAGIAGVLGVASQAGDLFESWVKRRFGVKDSGWLIPGHGGLLDRLDGLLAAAPVAACVVLTVGRGAAVWN